MAEQESMTLLDNGMFTHRVDDQQPKKYDIEGLKYKGVESRVLRRH